MELSGMKVVRWVSENVVETEVNGKRHFFINYKRIDCPLTSFNVYKLLYNVKGRCPLPFALEEQRGEKLTLAGYDPTHSMIFFNRSGSIEFYIDANKIFALNPEMFHHLRDNFFRELPDLGESHVFSPEEYTKLREASSGERNPEPKDKLDEEKMPIVSREHSALEKKVRELTMELHNERQKMREMRAHMENLKDIMEDQAEEIEKLQGHSTKAKQISPVDPLLRERFAKYFKERCVYTEVKAEQIRSSAALADHNAWLDKHKYQSIDFRRLKAVATSIGISFHVRKAGSYYGYKIKQ